jgi:hypothetical protein
MVVHRGKLPVASHRSLALGSWELGLVPAGHRADRANAVIRNAVIRNDDDLHLADGPVAAHR